MHEESPKNDAPITGPAPDAQSLHRRLLNRKKCKSHLDIISGILLALAGLATSWAGYQSTRWSGVQATKYVQANALRVEGNRDSTIAGQLQALDVWMFVNWLTAHNTGNTQEEQFYRKLFRPEFVPAFEAWLANKPAEVSGIDRTPFLLPEYRVSFREKFKQLESDAERLFREGQVANETGDQYVMVSVILSAVLFFIGVSQQMEHLRVRAVMLVVATLMCVLGLYHLAAYPVE